MIGSLSLLIALGGFLVLAAYLFATRNQGWGSWAAGMPLDDDPPTATEESA